MKNLTNNFTVMRPHAFSPITIMLLFILFLVSNLVNAQPHNRSASSRELYDKIASLDSSLFEAFNRCNLVKVETFFTEDLEFYHEKSGLTASRKSVIAIMRKNLCGESSNRVRRELVKDSLEVFPINNYGAVQAGEHRFYLTQEGQKEKLDGIGKFVHIWQKQDGEWKISRVISYGFRLPE